VALYGQVTAGRFRARPVPPPGRGGAGAAAHAPAGQRHPGAGPRLVTAIWGRLWGGPPAAEHRGRGVAGRAALAGKCARVEPPAGTGRAAGDSDGHRSRELGAPLPATAGARGFTRVTSRPHPRGAAARARARGRSRASDWGQSRGGGPPPGDEPQRPAPPPAHLWADAPIPASGLPPGQAGDRCDGYASVQHRSPRRRPDQGTGAARAPLVPEGRGSGDEGVSSAR
jgi:hypothetical protein